ALACGAQVPFMRPANLADDFTGTAAVIGHALQELHRQGLSFEYVCCVYATAPLLQTRFLQQGLDVLAHHPDKSFAFSVCDFGFP
ncbi:pseudaminic acid cytidylyltransferase, partial [Pseudomonas sp. 10C3]|nr:pseudaminic acid cytidylyltransferase [Pseudomonas sp. 10C3]